MSQRTRCSSIFILIDIISIGIFLKMDTVYRSSIMKVCLESLEASNFFLVFMFLACFYAIICYVLRLEKCESCKAAWAPPQTPMGE